MRLTALRYAQEFGKLAKIRGIVYYRLSPYEQKPFAGTITHGAPNMVRRVREQILRVMPAIIIGGLTYYWAEEEYYRLNRKNPDDYKDDV